MNIKPLTPDLSVVAQINAADVGTLAAAGFRSLICNRPDGETPDQTPYETIRQAAEAAGLPIRHLPAETGKVTAEHGAQFAQLMNELPKPVLAYCRSGLRSTTMWAFTQVDKKPMAEILDTAARAGYNLSAVNGLVNR